MDSSTAGNHLDVGGSFGVLAQAGGEARRDAEFLGEALSEESSCGGSLESFLTTPNKGWASGHALLHAGVPCLDPSEADKASGSIVFRRRGLSGNAEEYIPAAAAGLSAISHSGSYIKVLLCGWGTTRFWL